MDVFSFESGSSDQWDLQAIVRQCSSCPDSIMISKPLIRHENEAFEALKTGNNGGVDDDCGKGRGRLQKQNSEGGAKERRRKCKQKTSFVQQFAGDRALSDHWNWRKYGQKSIKGSPYPRSYYKCSSSGDCLARKQVEHSRSDPGTFLITYINEHNHPYPTRRHSQAGRTKERFDTTTTSSNKVASTVESSSNYTWTTSNSDLETPSFGHNHDHHDHHDRGLGLKCTKDDHEFGIGQEDSVDGLDMVLDDEFFAGLEYLEGLEMDLLFP